MSTLIRKTKARGRSGASARVNLRIHPRVKALLVRAARLRGVRLTEFMINTSQAAAEAALTEGTEFVLPAAKWKEFRAALDAPPRFIPALRELMHASSVFEDK